MDITKLSLNEKELLSEALKNSLPLIEALDTAIYDLQNYYLKEFEEMEIALKEILVNDESISSDDVATVYNKELLTIKEDIQERATVSFNNIKDQFLAIAA